MKKKDNNNNARRAQKTIIAFLSAAMVILSVFAVITTRASASEESIVPIPTGEEIEEHHTSGDNPLSTYYTFSGNGGAVIAAVGSTAASGSFTVSGIPSGSTIVKAVLYTASWEYTATSISASFTGVPLGNVMTFSHDPGVGYGTYDLNAWRWDITSLVTGDGVYSWSFTGRSQPYGNALVVVYSNPSSPFRQIFINDGSESLYYATSITTFNGVLAGPATLAIFEQAGDWTDEAEKISFNGVTVLGPANIFNGNLGYAASLNTVSVSTIAGANTASITTGVDWLGWHLAILAVTPPAVNQPPVVTDIGGYTDPDSGTITFTATASDPDPGDVVEQVEFDVYYSGAWYTLGTDTNGADGWSYSWDSAVVKYDPSVYIKARAYDGLVWGNWYQEGPFTVDNRIPPVANANGPYTGNEGSPITFSGSGSSDPDGTIVLYEWDLDGNGQYDDAIGVNPQSTWNDDYSGIIGLKVTDNDGLTDTDSTTVTVNNVPPIASVLNDGPKDEGTPITVTASQIDPGADTFTYSFDWNNDGIYEIIDQISNSAQYTFMDDGIYTVGVRVKDDDGGIGTATTQVTVLDLAPTTEFTWSPEPQNEGLPVQFIDQSTSWPDLLVSWNWNFGDGGMTSLQNPTNVYGDNGIYTVSLTVTDDDGSTSIISHDVTIVNVAPTVNAGPDQTVNEGDTVSFSGSFTDPGWLDSHTAQINWGDGTVINITEIPYLVPNGAPIGLISASHTYCDNGVYTVTVTVTDDDGGAGQDTLQVTINNVPPTVNAGPGQEVFAGDTVQFNGSFTDPGTCDTHTYTWDFGDGSPVVTETLIPTHIYYGKGTYTVTLTVTDDDGGVGTDTLQVMVKPIPATIDCDPDTLNLKSKGDWITCYIELPSGYDVRKIDATTILLNGLIPPELNPKYGFVKSEQSYIMDHDGDGVLERMVKFDRAAVQAILSPGQVVLTITGNVFYNAGLADFEGKDTIRVIK